MASRDASPAFSTGEGDEPAGTTCQTHGQRDRGSRGRGELLKGAFAQLKRQKDEDSVRNIQTGSAGGGIAGSDGVHREAYNAVSSKGKDSSPHSKSRSSKDGSRRERRRSPQQTISTPTPSDVIQPATLQAMQMPEGMTLAPVNMGGSIAWVPVLTPGPDGKWTLPTGNLLGSVPKGGDRCTTCGGVGHSATQCPSTPPAARQSAGSSSGLREQLSYGLSGKQPRRKTTSRSSSSDSLSASQLPSQHPQHLKTHSQGKASPRKGSACASTGSKDTPRDLKGNPSSGQTVAMLQIAREEDEIDRQRTQAVEDAQLDGSPAQDTPQAESLHISEPNLSTSAPSLLPPRERGTLPAAHLNLGLASRAALHGNQRSETSPKADGSRESRRARSKCGGSGVLSAGSSGGVRAVRPPPDPAEARQYHRGRSSSASREIFDPTVSTVDPESGGRGSQFDSEEHSKPSNPKIEPAIAPAPCPVAAGPAPSIVVPAPPVGGEATVSAEFVNTSPRNALKPAAPIDSSTTALGAAQASTDPPTVFSKVAVDKDSGNRHDDDLDEETVEEPDPQPTQEEVDGIAVRLAADLALQDEGEEEEVVEDDAGKSLGSGSGLLLEDNTKPFTEKLAAKSTVAMAPPSTGNERCPPRTSLSNQENEGLQGQTGSLLVAKAASRRESSRANRPRPDLSAAERSASGQGDGGGGGARVTAKAVGAQSLAESWAREMRKRGESVGAMLDLVQSARRSFKQLVQEGQLAQVLRHALDQRLWGLDRHIAGALKQASSSSKSSEHNPSPAQILGPGPGSLKEDGTSAANQLEAHFQAAGEFYMEVLASTATAYGLELDSLSPVAGCADLGLHEDEVQSIAPEVLLCHFCLLSLGDIARYKIDWRHAAVPRECKNWELARADYLKAARLMPWSGRAQNCLAVTSAYAGDELGAAYRWLRALTAARPFPARENLLSLFERNYQRLRRESGMQGQAALHHLPNAQRVELTFLRLHGALYTRVGLEQAEVLTCNCLADLRIQLEAAPAEGPALAQSRLLELVLMTIFSVHYNSAGRTQNTLPLRGEGAPSPPALPNGPPSPDAAQWPEALVIAVEFAVEFLDCFVRAARLELEDHSDSTKLSGDESQGWWYLPATCIMLDWIRLNPGYFAVRADEAKEALWTGVVRLINALPQEGGARLLGTDLATALPEDVELRGFPPLEASLSLRVPPPPLAPVPAATARQVRMARVRAFGKWVAGGGIPGCIFYHPEIAKFSTDGVAPPPASPGPSSADKGLSEQVAGDTPEGVGDALLATGAAVDTGVADVDIKAEPPVQNPEDPLDRPQIRGLLVGVDLASGGSHRRGGGGSHSQRRGGGFGGDGGGGRIKGRGPEDNFMRAHEFPGGSHPPSHGAAARTLTGGPAAFNAQMGKGVKSEDAPQEARKENLIIVDAPNVAMRHGSKKVFSCEGIRITLQYWLDRGFKVVGFLPEYYTDHEYVGKMRNATKLGLVDRPSKIPDNIALIKQLEEQGLLVLTPPQDYDDSYCIAYARKHGGFIITNDRYWDYIEKAGSGQSRRETLQWIRSHCISYTFAGNEFLPNPDFQFVL